MTTIDPATGATHLDPNDPREIADKRTATEYREAQMREFGEVHAPYAYPVHNPETGDFDWYGG